MRPPLAFALAASMLASLAVVGADTPARLNLVLGIVGTPTSGPDASSEGAGADADATAAPSTAPTEPVRADPAAAAERADARLAPARPDSLTGYVWPIHDARFSQPFRARPTGAGIVDGGAYHDGIDMASWCGDRIYAAHDGVVLAAGRHYDSFMGWVGDLGPYTARLDAKKLWSTLPIIVVVDDGNGYRSVYAHFRRTIVRPGDTVVAGQLIGYEGATGRAYGCHLHYELFSPLGDVTVESDRLAVEHMLLPVAKLARIDPLLVLPPFSAAGIHYPH